MTHHNNPEFFGTNDPLALAALIEAELTNPEPGRTTIELSDGPPLLTPKAALTIAARACSYLLTGEPAPQTFEPADLELAIEALRQMAAAIREVRSD